jgi:hypothetical protein
MKSNQILLEVSTIAPLLHTLLHLDGGLTRRTNVRNLGTFQKAMFFSEFRGTLDRKEVSRTLEVGVHLEGPASGQLDEAFSVVFLSWYKTPRCTARCSYPPKRTPSPQRYQSFVITQTECSTCFPCFGTLMSSALPNALQHSEPAFAEGTSGQC